MTEVTSVQHYSVVDYIVSLCVNLEMTAMHQVCWLHDITIDKPRHETASL